MAIVFQNDSHGRFRPVMAALDCLHDPLPKPDVFQKRPLRPKRAGRGGAISFNEIVLGTLNDQQKKLYGLLDPSNFLGNFFRANGPSAIRTGGQLLHKNGLAKGGSVGDGNSRQAQLAGTHPNAAAKH